MEKNLTTGSVLKNILFFSLPYLFSYFLQTLYGMADLFIIGQFEGVAATTAVSIGSQVMHMLTVMIVGLAMGTTVSIAQAIGANKKDDAAAATGNTVTLFLILSVCLTGALLCVIRPITVIMSVPEEAVSGTIAYLTICFIGIPFITAYNIISSIFRGMGDSKSPMYFIAVACVANIILDYIFIGLCHFGPAGAALGTTVSQAISVIVSLFVIVKRKTGISLKPSDFRPKRNVCGTILKIGIPIACQDGLIQIAFIIITIIANKRRSYRFRRCRHCREGNQLLVFGAILDALYCLCTRCSKHRCRKARACQAYSSLCNLYHGWVWSDCGYYHPIYCRASCWTIHN